MRIAYLEDDPAQQELTSNMLKAHGYDCCAFSDGSRLIRRLRREHFDMLLLDWQVPGVTGHEVMVWARTHLNEPIPIIFATYRSLETDIVSALNAGADDYLVKPLRKAELLARVDALARRVRSHQSQNMQPQLIEVGPYRIDPEKRSCMLHDVPIELTPREFDLTLLMFQYLGRILSREQIGGTVWGQPPGGISRTIDTHMSKVRAKLQLRPENGIRLLPVYGHGYRLELVSEAS
ncbi:response regulator transcription factor [Paraburkholderia humisilvae]|uniref:Sensory transduction protein regX3 n=1 Tax=Paraburkholderia humisilvae TaxID=627669 RepID=A0A6J5F8D5_9BURK|nr:response regulator transcription factor [Paraburkholderia humisilvae]CAB3773892.1 Sensory transduction protein regX3 [Paraburkholderia humisilvae]